MGMTTNRRREEVRYRETSSVPSRKSSSKSLTSNPRDPDVPDETRGEMLQLRSIFHLMHRKPPLAYLDVSESELEDVSKRTRLVRTKLHVALRAHGFPVDEVRSSIDDEMYSLMYLFCTLL